jgi:hypothetical protein
VADNVIELNGKRYDAVSGAYLGTTDTEAVPAVPHTVTQSVKRNLPKGRAIDGFIRPTATSSHKVSSAKTVQPAHKIVAAPAAPAPKQPGKHGDRQRADITHTTSDKHTLAHAHKAAAAARAHKPQHAETLMRSAVNKPEFSMKPAIKPQAPAEMAAKQLSAITVKRSALQVDHARVERAKNIVRHGGIRRFMPVRPDHSPAGVAATPHRAVHDVPVIPVHAVPAPVEHRPRSHSDIFEAAIARADSHKQPKHKGPRPPHRRLINTMAVIGAFLVIGGFITYLNIPNIQLHVASIQAGFKADVPNYKPTGYALRGGIKRTGNTVSMRFISGENNYTVTEQPSDWNSQTLVENTLALSGDKHKTIEAGGRTVYIYDGNNAVWVNGGVRYDINTNAPLTTDDISKLAGSL